MKPRDQRSKELRRRLHMYVLSVKLLDEVGGCGPGPRVGAGTARPLCAAGWSGRAVPVLQEADAIRCHVRRLCDSNSGECR